MGRTIGILCMVAALWALMEIHNEGLQGAFGGVFASWGDASEPVDARPAHQRAREAVQRAQDLQEERYQALLEKGEDGP